MRRLVPITSLTLLALTHLAACGSTKGDAPSTEGTEETVQSLLMTRAQTCGDLDEALREDARLRLEAQVAARLADPYYYEDGQALPPPSSGGMGAAGTIDTGSPTGTGGTSSVGGDSDGEAPAYSATNTQVAGIDEADIIKNDGQNVYVLRGAELTVAQAYPADSMTVLAKQAVEGTAREMYVVGGPTDARRTVVVYSDVDATPLYAEAGIAAPANSGTYPGQMIDCWDCYYYYGLPATKVTVFTVEGAAVTVAKELYYEGSYLSSRRNANQVRTTLQVPSRAAPLDLYADDADVTKATLIVLQELTEQGRDAATIPSEELYAMVQEKVAEVVVAEQEAVIETITSSDWLPRFFVREAGALRAESLPCDAFYLPAAGSTDAGVTLVASLDLEALAGDPAGIAILGLADTLYENASKVVLASANWSYLPESGTSSTETIVHEFDVSEPGAIVYQASGRVSGLLHNQFSIDEAGGDLRLVTTDEGDEANQWMSSTHLYVLQAEGSELRTVGTAGPIGEGEQVFAVRYVGDTAYVVTFLQTDPLYVIDVADPTAPTVLGEAIIPGFSEYMHPLGDDYLLTIGREADPATGWSQNLALQIFDVADPLAPALAHKHVFADAGYSTAESNHKAFAYFAEFGLLAMPFYGETYDEFGYYRATSSLELFTVDVDAGFTYLGALDGTSLVSDAEQSGAYYCDPYAYSYGYGSTPVERGLYIDETLYAVGQRGIIASSLAAPATPVAVLPFEDPTVVPANCWSGTGGTMVEGTGGMATGGADAGGTSGTGSVPAEGGAASQGVGGTGAI